MTSEVMGTGKPVNKENLKELLKETTETLATETTEQNTPSFTAVDLWNVQKRQKTAATMQRRFWLN
jgi:hypothetical protein